MDDIAAKIAGYKTLHFALINAQDEVEKKQVELAELEEKVENLHVELNKRAETLRSALVSGRSQAAARFAVGAWECPNSPLGLCVYDDDEDPGHDDCVFCDLPNE